MRPPTFIPLPEAAEIVGVTKETLYNLCKQNKIRYRKHDKFYQVSRTDILNYKNDIWEIGQLEGDIEEYKEQLKQVRRQTAKALEEQRLRLHDINMFPARIQAIIQWLAVTIQQHDTYQDVVLNAREIELVMNVLQGKQYAEIAEEIGITRERVSQIWLNALRKWRREESELQRLRRIVNDISKDNEDKIRVLQIDKDILEILKKPVNDDEFDLSVRALNCLKASQLDTVADVVKHNKLDLLKIRNFGKRSLNEIENMLTSHGLHFGMDISEYELFMEKEKS